VNLPKLVTNLDFLCKQFQISCSCFVRAFFRWMEGYYSLSNSLWSTLLRTRTWSTQTGMLKVAFVFLQNVFW